MEKGVGKYKITCKTKLIGEDLVIFIQGGEKHHIGAISVGLPRESLNKKGAISSDATTVAIPYHKEDMIAREWAKNTSKIINRVTVAIVGIHIDDATSKDIEILMDNNNKLLDEFIKLIKDKINKA
ncbi:hypothetical protein [Miniphocaeibacter halophilus]|uniref:Uncharacterized protein n=1 Tax=Miniphocaeibacter halophilus TaxID=2931922 RepID=A0AC61MTG6_9FIRM|nr:hypothetical protein [Miniphocaeibacter halophilus]QQK08807.1 hypothetical protein JFY71_04545 [Miniphocaeibacter halophilus]